MLAQVEVCLVADRLPRVLVVESEKVPELVELAAI
jgi:hypothetical protein